MAERGGAKLPASYEAEKEGALHLPSHLEDSKPF